MARKIEVECRTAYLSEEDWQQLVHRFDIKNPGYWYHRPCICAGLAEGRASIPLSCPGCAFRPWGYRRWVFPWAATTRPPLTLGCMYLLKHLGLQHDMLVLASGKIYAHGRQGLAQAKAIHDWLVALPQVPDAT